MLGLLARAVPFFQEILQLLCKITKAIYCHIARHTLFPTLDPPLFVSLGNPLHVTMVTDQSTVVGILVKWFFLNLPDGGNKEEKHTKRQSQGK